MQGLLVHADLGHSVILWKKKSKYVYVHNLLLHKKTRNIIFNVNHKTANYSFPVEEYLRFIRRISDILHLFAGYNSIITQPVSYCKTIYVSIYSYEKQ
jgi:hypothetical protein